MRMRRRSLRLLCHGRHHTAPSATRLPKHLNDHDDRLDDTQGEHGDARVGVSHLTDARQREDGGF